MKNLTFIGYVIEKNILDSCIILADYIWNPENENTSFYDFSISILKEVFEDYKKAYNETENLLDAVQEIVHVSRAMQRQAEIKGVKEREERQANSPIFE